MAFRPDSEVERFCGEYYRNLASRPLEPDDPFYVPLLERDELVSSDPVQRLLHCIQWQPSESVQLFSGFRGTGKSTELRRLARSLREAGHLVVLCDMEDYLNLSMPVDVSDFLIAVAGAFGESLQAEDLLGNDPSVPSYWDRFTSFCKTRVEPTELDLKGLKIGLKADPNFKQKIQERMRGHLGSLVADVREFMADCVLRLRKRHGEDRKVVLLLDSIEHLRGTSTNAAEVHASLENLFSGHPDKLRFQSLHVVYTVPPWLKVRSPGVEGDFDGGELLPCLKVRDRSGDPFAPGIGALAEVLERRGDWRRLLGGETALETIVLASGGYLRDLFRLVQSVLLLTAQRNELPVPEEAVSLAIADVRNDYLPISREDAVWLAQVNETHRAELPAATSLADLARFFDTHLVLCYRNGEEWFDVHPLIRERIRQHVENAEDGTDRT